MRFTRNRGALAHRVLARGSSAREFASRARACRWIKNTRQCVVDICILCDAAAIRSRQLVSRNGLISPFPVQVDEMKCFIFHQLWGIRWCGAIPGRSDFHWRAAASIMGSGTCILGAAASPAKRRHRYLWAAASCVRRRHRYLWAAASHPVWLIIILKEQRCGMLRSRAPQGLAL